MSDTKNFIELASSISRNWTGSEMTPEDVVKEFALHGHAKRAAILDGIDQSMAGNTEVSNNETSLREFAQLTRVKRQMEELHHNLRKIGR